MCLATVPPLHSCTGSDSLPCLCVRRGRVQATADAALASEPFLTHMSQGWRVLLLSDGSVTRHLHLLTGHRVSVDCLEMRAIGHSLLGVPPGTALVAGPRVQRQVGALLRLL